MQSLTFDGGASVTGNLNFLEGYQVDIAITGSTITFGAGSKYGVPIACGTFFNFIDDCDSIISYINGVAADGKGIIHLLNGGGMVILDDPENHRIFVGMPNGSEDVCKDIPINPAL